MIGFDLASMRRCVILVAFDAEVCEFYWFRFGFDGDNDDDEGDNDDDDEGDNYATNHRHGGVSGGGGGLQGLQLATPTVCKACKPQPRRFARRANRIVQMRGVACKPSLRPDRGCEYVKVRSYGTPQVVQLRMCLVEKC